MMKMFTPMKRLLPYILVSVVVNSIVGWIFPRGLFILEGIFILILFNQIFFKSEESLIISDMLFVGSIIAIGGLSVLLFFGGCFIFPHLNSCTSNMPKEVIILLIFFPLMIGLILWMFLRLPMIVKSLFNKKK
jgi:hypothetical protein